MTDETNNALLFSEGWLFSALLDMVVEHCSNLEGKLDSFGRPAHATAMRLLAGAGFIEIENETDERIVARMMPAGQDLTAQVRAAESQGQI